MPTYEFRCSGCGKKFEHQETVAQHDRHREVCPDCSSRKVEQVPSSFQAVTSKKS